ncbi:MAG: hypothetical protein II710_04290 [Clostridia bacterium]|nr:hypothetical protein [Clostridia bacterium]
MKRILALVLALVMLTGLLLACTPNSQKPAGPNGSGTQSGNNDPSTQSGNNNNPEGARLSGKLTIINLDDRDPSVLRGVKICGMSVGTASEFNNKESSLTDVRCIFELNEWVEFYPDTDKTYGLRVWILKHRDDQEYYNNAKFSDLMPNFANYCDLHYPEDVDTPDEWYWGNFYLHEEEFEPGYYDFVFTYEGKAIAVLVTRFYRVGELSGKSDADLEALMHAS